MDIQLNQNIDVSHVQSVVDAHHTAGHDVPFILSARVFGKTELLGPSSNAERPPLEVRVVLLNGPLRNVTVTLAPEDLPDVARLDMDADGNLLRHLQ